MKRPQWIVIVAAIALTTGLYFARTTPKKNKSTASTQEHSADDGHDHGNLKNLLPVDSILAMAKKNLTAEQVVRINTLENSITRGAVKDQQLHVYHQLARFWKDSARIFEPYAWYEGEGARLENSEKTLTFAARLFLENLQQDDVMERRQWKALQAKDLFERALKLNSANDSAKVGLGACYLFGSISEAPMEGISKIREVIEKDSTNLYALMMLAKGAILSGQYDKAIERLEHINEVKKNDPEAMLMLADLYERTDKKAKAIEWYEKANLEIKQPELKDAVAERIKELKK